MGAKRVFTSEKKDLKRFKKIFRTMVMKFVVIKFEHYYKFLNNCPKNVFKSFCSHFIQTGKKNLRLGLYKMGVKRYKNI